MMRQRKNRCFVSLMASVGVATAALALGVSDSDGAVGIRPTGELVVSEPDATTAGGTCNEGAGDCCEANGSPGCNDIKCCQAVCFDDPFCCVGVWDDTCADAAMEICLVCGGTGGPAQIATGPDSAIDGYLLVKPDDYGAWATPFNGADPGPNDDHFNPLGNLPLRQAAFTCGLFLFVGDTQRELLSDIADWQGIIPFDASLDRAVTSPAVGSDTNDDGIFDTMVSSFDVFGGATSLSFELTQKVFIAGEGIAVVQQDYVITNNSGAIDFVLVTTFDGDLFWIGDFEDDSVGTLTNGMPGLDRFVYEMEAGNTATAITVSSPQGETYYGAKLGIDPDGGGIPYGFGTDFQIWEAYGVPDGSGGADGSDWRNHVAAVGYDTDGASGASPPGCGTRCDASMGLEIPVSLEKGATTTVTIFHTYGSNIPFTSEEEIAVVSSDPPDGAIDARQPSEPDGSAPDGWDSITLTFDGDSGGVTVSDFSVSVDPPGTAPIIIDVSTDGTDATLQFDTTIPLEAWTIVTHDPSDTSVRIGSLPSDVNNDKFGSANDVLFLIDSLNGVVDPLPAMYQTDADRSGATNASDVLRVIDLLNGAGVYDEFLGATLPD